MSKTHQTEADESQEERIDALEARVDELESIVSELTEGGGNNATPSNELAAHYGFSDYVEPAVVALIDGKEHRERVTLEEVKAYIKRETACSNPKTVKKYAKEITKRGPFKSTGAIGTWELVRTDSVEL